MPLTPFQQEVFAVIRTNRSPESFVYGAVALHAGDSSPRYSRDVDLSHDLAESVAGSAAVDAQALTQAGLRVQWLLRQPTFQRAEVTAAGKNGAVVIEWVNDSAFRFFPVEADPVMGYRLHRFDAATNKILALASRAEARDFVDALHLHRGYLSLGALAWAAAGKDEGLNPLMILEMAVRFAHYRQADLDALDLTEPLSIKPLVTEWRAAMADASKLIAGLPAHEMGCAYLNKFGAPVEPVPGESKFPSLKRHFGSVGGGWPRLA